MRKDLIQSKYCYINGGIMLSIQIVFNEQGKVHVELNEDHGVLIQLVILYYLQEKDF